MNALRPSARLRTSHFALRRIQTLPRRTYATEPPPAYPPSSPPNPNPQPREPSRVGAYYRNFGSPLLKCFLGALFTYQLLYWGWMKLEIAEEKYDKENEIKSLTGELKDAVVRQKEKASEIVDGVVEAGDKGRAEEEKGTKKGWWPW